MPIQFSVIICTYNRANLLAQALDSVCEQTLSPSAYEVIVVDNRSNDQTKSIVERRMELNINLRYFLETQVGLSYARNRGWHEARGEYLAYIDDDCIAPKEWLAVAWKVIQQISPSILGGPYYAFFNTQTPNWFKDDYGSHMMGNEARFLNADEYLSGGNFFVHKNLLKIIGGFRIELGMAGENLAYGEETALIRWARQNMPQASIYYEPRLFVYHLVRENKMQLSWLLRERFAAGRYGYLIFTDGQHKMRVKHFLGLIGIPVVLMYACSLGILFRDRKKYPYFQNYFYERIMHWIAVYGKLYERLRCTMKKL